MNTQKAVRSSETPVSQIMIDAREFNLFLLENGAQEIVPADGGEMSESEWQSYCQMTVSQSDSSSLLELLKRFCSDRGEIHDMSEPYTIGAYTYASSNHIAVRVPVIREIMDNCEAPETDKLAWHHAKANQFGPLPDYSLDQADPCQLCLGTGLVKACPECEGEGLVVLENDYHTYTAESDFVCPDCEGQKLDLDFVVPYHKIGLKARDLELIKTLPGVEIAPPVIDVENFIYEPVMFRFDGGEGLVMPTTTGKD